MKSYVEIDRWTLSEELWLYGEDGVYLRPLEMSDRDLFALYQLAAKIYFDERKARSAGEASARAAVALLEGRERPLARKRRRPRSGLPAHRVPLEARMAEVNRITNQHLHAQASR